ncbi:restriction endonuclease subunit S [Parvicella tangerina]|uniref:Type I restriction modification DNA specificity domain-containing protein n=1 Tax=Parvicella tangerina TaxID=2829795 RepID=A0A916JKI3_9FLAO|nr:restriction endonuclease subunit S [Parvicella tangerina]CAG5077593.1 hypothetical protein CRYO30217_00433 [Parvicella tangerina]
MKKYFKIKELAEIRFGINARTVPNGTIPCLQGKDFDEFGELDETGITFVPEEDCGEKDWLQKGDVLFAAKGSRNYAVVWMRSDMRVVASATFFVIRLKKKEVLPRYLAWYLMSTHAVRYFERNVKTATIKTISKKVFDQLEVEIPSKERQNKLIVLHYLLRDEQRISALIKEKRERLIMNL